ncbi:MAG: hypothetical protein LBH18_03110 [Spirochaetaceae bacterium]|jgi:hypothetical protein|nr:hypothetical protein [Spirochaetaceae bacterium]
MKIANALKLASNYTEFIPPPPHTKLRADIPRLNKLLAPFVPVKHLKHSRFSGFLYRRICTQVCAQICALSALQILAKWGIFYTFALLTAAFAGAILRCGRVFRGKIHGGGTNAIGWDIFYPNGGTASPLNRKATKPNGVHGISYAWQVRSEKPASGEDLSKSRFNRKTSMIIAHTEHEKGMTAYYAVCCENNSGDKGQWPQVEEAIIG